MKRLFSVLVILALVLSDLSPICFSDAGDEVSLKYLLSLEPTEALDELIELGLILPEAYTITAADYAAAAEASYRILLSLNNNPSSTYGYDYTEMALLADRIRAILGDKIDWTKGTRSQGMYSQTLYGDTWYSSYANYNCYAYALGYTTMQINPGYFAGITLSGSQYSNISSVRNAINQDLLSLGYYVSISSAKPSSIPSGGHVICVRCASGSGGYHVMKAHSLSVWYHKPAQSAPLKLLDTSSTSPITNYWSNEMYYIQGWSEGDITYNSSAWFFTYWT